MPTRWAGKAPAVRRQGSPEFEITSGNKTAGTTSGDPVIVYDSEDETIQDDSGELSTETNSGNSITVDESDNEVAEHDVDGETTEDNDSEMINEMPTHRAERTSAVRRQGSLEFEINSGNRTNETTSGDVMIDDDSDNATSGEDSDNTTSGEDSDDDSSDETLMHNLKRQYMARRIMYDQATLKVREKIRRRYRKLRLEENKNKENKKLLEDVKALRKEKATLTSNIKELNQEVMGRPLQLKEIERFTCSICYKTMNVVSICGHPFCKRCIDGYLKARVTSRTSHVPCPYCRESLEVKFAFLKLQGVQFQEQ